MAMFGKLFGGKDSDKDDDKDADKKPGKKSAKKKASRSRSSTSVRSPSSVSVRRSPRSSTSTTVQPRSLSKSPSGRGSPIGKLAPRALKGRVSKQGKQLGALLIKNKAITEEQLDKALEEQEKNGGLLGQVLVRLGACELSAIGTALKKQRTITTVTLEQVVFDPEIAAAMPRAFCVKCRLIPFEKIGNHICVAMANVLDSQAKTDIKEKTQFMVKPFDAPWNEIQAAIDQYLPEEEVAEAVDAVDEIEDDFAIDLPEGELDVANASVSSVVELAPDDTVPEGVAAVIAPRGTTATQDDIEEIDDLEMIVDISGDETIEAGINEAGEVEALAEVDELEEIEEVESIDDLESIEDGDDIEEIEEADDDAVEAIGELNDLDPLADFDLDAEDDDDIAVAEVATIRVSAPSAMKVGTQPLPRGVLAAIPMPADYFSEVVRSGKTSSERRWLADHIGDTSLPMEPAPDLKVS